MTAAFATQTREMDFLLEFFNQMKLAAASGDYAALEPMIDEQAVFRTTGGRKVGRDLIVQHLKAMDKTRHRKQIVAPKGGYVTVNVLPLAFDGTLAGRPHEQIYHIRQDRLVELIDLGRTPDMVNRPESQPM